MKNCKHGMVEGTCGLCKGLSQENGSQTVNGVTSTNYVKPSKDKPPVDPFFDEKGGNHGEDWTIEDLEAFHLKLQEFGENQVRFSKVPKKEVKAIAQLLGRSYQSVRWHYLHVYIIKDPRAGKLIEDFRLENGLQLD